MQRLAVKRSAHGALTVLGWAAICAAALIGTSARAGVFARATQRSGTEDPATMVRAFRSSALQSIVHFVVQLPAGYSSSSRRYPVVYFLHGLPAGPRAYRSMGWVGKALAAERRSAILVVPQATRADNGDPEYHDWGPGRDWATALAAELPNWIDTHYRTIANRTGRAIIGVSAGGYGATSLGLSHPSEYSVVESWSGYFEPTDPTGTRVIDLGSRVANRAADIHAQIAALVTQFARYPTFFGFYVGRSDRTFAQENIHLNQELQVANVPHVYAIYRGGHFTSFWAAHATYWLQMALNHLATA